MYKHILPIVFIFLFVGCSQNKQEDNTFFYTDEKPSSAIRYLEDKFILDSINDSGVKVWSYPSGNLAAVTRFVKNKPYGSFEYFSEMGKIIKFEFYDHEGNLRYRAKFDNQGEITQDEGRPCYIGIMRPENNDTIDKNFVNLYPMLGIPRNYNGVIRILEESDTEWIFKEKVSLTSESKPIIIPKIIDNKNPQKLVFIFDLINQDLILHRSDTIYYVVK